MLLAGCLVFLVASFRRTPGEESVLWDAWVYDGLTLGAAAVVLARALLVRSERLAWTFLGLGLAGNGVGDVVYSLVSAGSDTEQFPSPADGFYLCVNPCFYVALLLLLRARLQRFPSSAWWDGLVAACAIGSVASAVAFPAITSATGGSTAAVVVGLAYPLGDLVLLAVTAGALGLLGWRVDPRWTLLSLGFALYAAVDTMFLLQSAEESYVEGTWMDTLWPAASLVLAFVSWRPARRLSTGQLAGWAVLVPPLVCTSVAVLMLEVAAVRPVPVPAVALATVTLLGAAGRFALSYRDAAALADSRRLALTDDLTDLANRRALLAELEAAAAQPAIAVGMLLIDLDRFKEINDSLGHHVGDELLRQLAARLRTALRPNDLLARLGGDEFAVLLRAQPDQPQDVGAVAAQQAAQRLARVLDEPFHLDDVALHVTASIGIALTPDHATDPRELLQRADVAMYAAKSNSTRIGLYRLRDDPHSRERLHTLEELRAALRTGGIVCHYQPKVTLGTGRVDGVEALVRWQHPVRGLLAPEEFLELAEHAGLMRELTARVLDASLTQVRRWHDSGIEVQVGVNMSATNLLDADLPDLVGRSLVSHDLPATALQIEITESVLMADSTRSREILNQLRAIGVGVAIDDYGTGYSSLAYLQDLAVDELKLDRVFVARMTHDPRAAAIVRSTIELAHSLGLRLVAEGVEDDETLAVLVRSGCDISQGYHHSRPLPADRLTTWLTDHHAQLESPVGVTNPVPNPRGGTRLGGSVSER